MTDKNKNESGRGVVTRIAPSPTGVMHIGTARTALFNYLFARKHGGKFLLRIEDTDTERSKPEYEVDIIEGLKSLGLDYDEFYRQSERKAIYESYINKMIQEGHAYVSKEESGDRTEVIRFKNPNIKITFNDLVRGEITFDTTDLGDFVIAKSMTEPLYHLAVVVDDFEMNITHIIRGDDGISNTPRQILIQRAIGAPTPEYAHLPLILGPDKSKLSKRHGATSLVAFKKSGFLKEAILNHLAFLGWNPGTDQEIFSLEQLITDFSLDKVSKGGAVFNIDKLKWFNHHYLLELKDEEFIKIFVDNFKEYLSQKNIQIEPTKLESIILNLKNIILERCFSADDLKIKLEEGEFDFCFQEPNITEPEKIIWRKSDAANTIAHLNYSLDKIKANWPNRELTQEEKINYFKELIFSYAEENGKGDVLWPLRFCLTGLERSPDPLTILSIIDQQTAIGRIEKGIELLK